MAAVEYATTTGVNASIAHAIITVDGVERAACRKSLRLHERRSSAWHVDRNTYLSFCLACDRKVERHSCREHGMYAGVTECPRCAEAARLRRDYEDRVNAENSRWINTEVFDRVPATRPADQSDRRFRVVEDGVLPREVPIFGTSLRGPIHHIPAADGNGESWRWTRTIHGQAYRFTLVRMPVSSIYPNGQVRVFVSKFNGYVGGPRFGCAWSPVREFSLTPDPVPAANPETLPRGVVSRIRRFSSAGETEEISWRRTIRGKLYEFTSTATSRETVLTVDRCDGDRHLNDGWTRLHDFVTAHPAIGCGHVGLGERHKFVPATQIDADRAHDNAEELCGLPEDAEVHWMEECSERRTPNSVDLEINRLLQSPEPRRSDPTFLADVLNRRQRLAQLRRELANLVAADGGWPRWAVQATETSAYVAEEEERAWREYM